MRRRADENLPGPRFLLQPRRHIERVAGGVRRRAGSSRDHLSGVQPHAHIESHTPLRLELRIECGQLSAHLQCGSHCPERVVIVDKRNPEHRHHRVTDELFDGAAVTLENRAHLLEVAPHDTAQRFRVESLAERRGTGDVCEEHGDCLAHLARCGDVDAWVLGAVHRSAAVDSHVPRLCRARTQLETCSTMRPRPWRLWASACASAALASGKTRPTCGVRCPDSMSCTSSFKMGRVTWGACTPDVRTP